MHDDLPLKPRRHVSPFVGRHMTISSSRRFVIEQRDKVTLKIWRAAPNALEYLTGVVGGKVDFSEGRFKAAIAILSRCIPTVTSQTVTTDGTMISARVDVPRNAAEELRARFERLERLATLAVEVEETPANGTGPEEELNGDAG